MPDRKQAEAKDSADSKQLQAKGDRQKLGRMLAS